MKNLTTPCQQIPTGRDPFLFTRKQLSAAAEYWQWTKRWSCRDKPIAPVGDYNWLEDWVEENKLLLSAVHEAGHAVAAIYAQESPLVDWVALFSPALRQTNRELYDDFEQSQIDGNVRVNSILAAFPNDHISFHEAGVAALAKALWDSGLHMDTDGDFDLHLRELGMGDYLDILEIKRLEKLDATKLENHRKNLRKLILTHWQTILKLARLLLRQGFVDGDTVFKLCVNNDVGLKRRVLEREQAFKKREKENLRVQTPSRRSR